MAFGYVESNLDFDDDGNVKVNLQVSTEDIVNGNKFSVNHRHADGGIP